MAETSAVDTAALAAAVLAAKQANFYQVSGDGITVTYSLSSFVGGPHFHYKDATIDKTFSGNQIQVTNIPLLGTVVSVLIRLTIDTGSTAFSLLIPRTNLGNHNSVKISTVGITAEHKFSPFGPVPPQSDLYTAHVLNVPRAGSSSDRVSCRRRAERVARRAGSPSVTIANWKTCRGRGKLPGRRA
jgi:hypothetical protein